MKRRKKSSASFDKQQATLNLFPLIAFRLGYLTRGIRFECVSLLRIPSPLALGLVLKECNGINAVVSDLRPVIEPSSFRTLRNDIRELKDYARAFAGTANHDKTFPFAEDDFGGLVLKLETESDNCFVETPDLLRWYIVGEILGNFLFYEIDDLYFALVRPQRTIYDLAEYVRQFPPKELALVPELGRLARFGSRAQTKTLQSLLMTALELNGPLDVISDDDIQAAKETHGLTRKADLERYFSESFVHNMFAHLIWVIEKQLLKFTEPAEPTQPEGNTAAIKRRRVFDPVLLARNKWIYETFAKGKMFWKEIRDKLREQKKFREHSEINSINAVINAARKHADLNGLPILSRQERRKGTQP